MQVDMSKIPDLEKRKQAQALNEAVDATYEEYKTAREKTWDAARAAANNDPAVVALAEKHNAAQKALDDLDCPSFLTDYNDECPVFCAISGVLLFDTDEYLRDPETDEYVLRSLVMGPRPAREEEDADEETSDDPEEQDAA